MRIIGHIEHPTLKITVFKMDNRLSVKFESALYEQTYKFRTAIGLENFEDIQNIVDESFIAQVETALLTMHQQKIAALARNMEKQKKDEFEEII